MLLRGLDGSVVSLYLYVSRLAKVPAAMPRTVMVGAHVPFVFQPYLGILMDTFEC